MSPSDVAAEREAVTQAVADWNIHVGRVHDAIIELVRWETHGVPDLSGKPQAVLNQQIVDGCDLGIALFWSRIGTPTEEFASGSIEEIERLLARRCRVMVYFKAAPIPQSQLDLNQLDALKKARQEIQARGLVGQFDTVEDLKRQVLLHLTSTVVDMLGANTQPEFVGSTQVLPRPDIRIRAQPAVATSYDGPSVTVLGIKVENHSPMPLYLSSIVISLKSQRLLYMPRDGLTGERLGRRTVNPGQSYSIHVTKEMLDQSSISIDDLDFAVALDEIGRAFESDPNEFQAAANELVK